MIRDHKACETWPWECRPSSPPRWENPLALQARTCNVLPQLDSTRHPTDVIPIKRRIEQPSRLERCAQKNFAGVRIGICRA